MADDPNAVAAEAAAKAASDKAAADKAAADAAAAEAAAAAAAKPQTVPLDRFQAVVAERAEERRGKEALARELKLAQDTIAEFKALGERGAAKPGDTTATKTNGADNRARQLSPEELQQLVREEASKQNFDQRCNAAAAAGKAAHADFDKIVLGDLTSVSPALDARTGRPVLPVALLEAALETGNAHEVLYELGKDMTEATRIMALRPVAQAVELTKFANKLAAKVEPELDAEGKPILPNVSRAPAPIKTPQKSGSTKPAFNVFDTEHFSTEEWIKQREKQIADARANK